MAEETENDVDLNRMKKAVAELGEFFDCVQLFCSRHDASKDDLTTSFHTGRGNWFARLGQTREWMAKKDEEARESARSDFKADNGSDHDPES